MDPVKLEIEADYRQSVYNDLLKEIRGARAQKRRDLVEYIIKTLPSALEGLLTLKEQRMLREYSALKRIKQPIEPKFEEEVRALLNTVEYLRKQGCYNLSSTLANKLQKRKRLYKLTIPGILISFCYDLATLLKERHINEEFLMINFPIKLPNGEVLIYPMDGVEVEAIVAQLYEADLDPSSKIMEFEQIQEAKMNLEMAKQKVRDYQALLKAPIGKPEPEVDYYDSDADDFEGSEAEGYSDDDYDDD